MNSKYDFRTLHEGFLKDIFDIATNIKKSDEFDIVSKLKKLGPLSAPKSNFDKGISQNIAKAAKGLTATFPLIVTEATPLDQAVMISKAVERKCCAMLQMLFAAHQISNATDAHSYIATFHNNLSNDYDISDYNVDDVIENMSDMNLMKESYEYRFLVEDCIKEVQEDCKNNIHYHLGESVNPESLNKYMIKKVFNEVQISGINTTQDTTSTNDIYDDDDRRISSTTTRIQKGSRIDVDDIKKSYDILANTIVKTDVQKANEATPSLLIVNFTSSKIEDENNKSITYPAIVTTCVIGVKCVIHYVKSADMVNKLVMKSGDRRGLFNLIRATTREISFFKDFLFSVDRAKIDALSKVGKGSTSSLWKMLELRAHNATYNKAKNKMDASCSAIATIVISRDEAEIIKKEHRIDITKPGTLLSIMRGYSFMAAALVDQNAEKVDFLWDDGDKNFETLSFMSLEREENGGMYKKVINMMSRGR